MSPLDIALDPIQAPGILAAKVWIKGGSSLDPDDEKGAHQLLGSVISRGCGPYNNLELANLVEGCGAGLRCDTTEDGLLISLKCSDSDAQQLLPVIGWMITNPHLDSDQVELERELTLQALQRQKENPFQVAFDGWRHLAYGKGPYGHDPLGITNDVKTLKRQNLLPIAKRLVDENQVMAISGIFPNDLKERLYKIRPFNELLSKKKEISIQTSKEEQLTNYINKNNSTITLEAEPTGQVVLMLGQTTIGHGHEDDLGLRLLHCHLGSGMSSLLFRELREKHGVAYEVGVHHPTRERTAPFLLHVSTSEEKAELTLQLILEIWENLKQTSLSEESLVLARAKYRGQIAHGSQTVAQCAERKALLRAFRLGDNYDKESIKKIEEITSKDLQNIAHKYFNKPLLSLCGPKETIGKLANKWRY
ncbi:pitrilysin family protein [Prochlorococcus sp. MIT 1307]|uniref:M16 family metallopeptidase n=1 Tax=Prochlorococcus sp. MIT 1307 TaxID=3096219 RepID=UPI002A749BF2|nr:pitrilysin family protein [Prochlorococcus sp. MIT 1307]